MENEFINSKEKEAASRKLESIKKKLYLGYLCLFSGIFILVVSPLALLEPSGLAALPVGIIIGLILAIAGGVVSSGQKKKLKKLLEDIKEQSK